MSINNVKRIDKNVLLIECISVSSFRFLSGFYPVRNNAPLLPPGQRPSGPAAAAGLDFRIIPAGFNASLGFESQRLEFLTGFT